VRHPALLFAPAGVRSEHFVTSYMPVGAGGSSQVPLPLQTCWPGQVPHVLPSQPLGPQVFPSHIGLHWDSHLPLFEHVSLGPQVSQFFPQVPALQTHWSFEHVSLSLQISQFFPQPPALQTHWSFEHISVSLQTSQVLPQVPGGHPHMPLAPHV
jgi:hypothetical protein